MGHHHSAFAVLALFLVGHAVAADKADFAEIDKHALAATADDEKTLAALARYLARPCKTDADKARAAYRWVTDRIAYDVDGVLTGRLGDPSAEAALKRRVAYCEGYANLYLDLCKRMGLQVVQVRGHAILDGDAANRVLTDRNAHSWNAVKLAGAWKLVDPTGGAGGFTGKEFHKHFDPYYFCTPPDRLLFTHLPADPRLQFVEKPISGVEFLRRPGPVHYVLLGLNVPTKDLLATAADKAFAGFPLADGRSLGKFTEARVPLNKTLKAGEEYVFEFTSATLNDLVIINDGQIIPFEKNGDKLTLKVTARKGKLAVGADGKEGQYAAVLLYTVE